MTDADQKFWKGKRVFLTGHTGFKGGWLAIWLASLGAEVKGYALAAQGEPSLFEAAGIADLLTSDINDVRDLERLDASIKSFSPDIVFHLAAQPLVRASYRNPVDTYSTNVMGTVHLLEAVRSTPSVRSVVIVTTDKCYENQEWIWGYRENEPMGGHDPYSNSKGCAELVVSAYRRSFFVDPGSPALASARAGNVIGGGDWSEDRLVPDIIKGFERGEVVSIRNPGAIRPWQHVLEPLAGYLALAKRLWQDRQAADAWNFGPHDNDARPVRWIADRMTRLWPGASWSRDGSAHPHEAHYLKLDISKATSRLDWRPVWSLDRALELIVSWHRDHRAGADMRQRCLADIEGYTNDRDKVIERRIDNDA